MTNARRSWVRAFADDPLALWAVRAAADSCMREVCEEHEPADCSCQVQMMTPLELADWIEQEVSRERREPVRLDHHENRSAGQQERRAMEFASAG